MSVSSTGYFLESYPVYSTRDELAGGRSFILPIFRKAAHETTWHFFTSPDNFIKRRALAETLSTFRRFSRAAPSVNVRTERRRCPNGREQRLAGGCRILYPWRRRGRPLFLTSAVALFQHGVFEVPSDNFKPLLLGQIKPRFERSHG